MPKQVDSASTSRHRVSNLEHGLDILELLREHPAGVTLSELARQLQLSKNLSYRISTTLLERGYLVRDEGTMRLMLGRKLLSMGYAAEAEVGLVEAALPSMRRLRDEFSETVTLCVLLEDEGMVLEAMPSSHRFRFVVETGMRFPLHASSPSKAIFAWLPDEEVFRRVAIRGMSRLTTTTITDKTQFREELAQVRLRGYAVDHQESFEGTHCVSAAIRNNSDIPIAALNITGPAHRFPTDSGFSEVGERVAALAQEITDRLRGV